MALIGGGRRREKIINGGSWWPEKVVESGIPVKPC